MSGVFAIQQTQLARDISLCSQFCKRSPSDVEEAHTVSVRSAFVSLGNVARDADRGPAELVSEAPVDSKGLAGCGAAQVDRKPARPLPNREILECSARHFYSTRTPLRGCHGGPCRLLPSAFCLLPAACRLLPAACRLLPNLSFPPPLPSSPWPPTSSSSLHRSSR